MRLTLAVAMALYAVAANADVVGVSTRLHVESTAAASVSDLRTNLTLDIAVDMKNDGDAAPLAGVVVGAYSVTSDALAEARSASAHSHIVTNAVRNVSIDGGRLQANLVGASYVGLETLSPESVPEPLRSITSTNAMSDPSAVLEFAVTERSFYSISVFLDLDNPDLAFATVSMSMLGTTPLQLFALLVSQSDIPSDDIEVHREYLLNGILEPGTYTLAGRSSLRMLLETPTSSRDANAGFVALVSVSPVPIPGAGWLLVSGLSLLPVLRRARASPASA